MHQGRLKLGQWMILLTVLDLSFVMHFAGSSAWPPWRQLACSKNLVIAGIFCQQLGTKFSHSVFSGTDVDLSSVMSSTDEPVSLGGRGVSVTG